MTIDDLLRSLRSWVGTLPQMSGEPELHAAIQQYLKSLNVACRSKPAIANPGADGKSEPDFLVTSVDPQLVIEVKADGNWRHAAEAAWQLFQSAELLGDAKPRKLAIFGGKLTDPIMLKMLTALDIEALCIQT